MYVRDFNCFVRGHMDAERKGGGYRGTGGKGGGGYRGTGGKRGGGKGAQEVTHAGHRAALGRAAVERKCLVAIPR